MTAIVEHTQEMGAASAPAAPLAKIKTRLADLWPPVMVGMGLFLTVVWAAGLVGLLVSLI
jgi:hypothetical protein